MSKKYKKKKQVFSQIYCDDCGELLNRRSTSDLIWVREKTNMPNLPAFCDDCRHKLKNRLKGYWHGLIGHRTNKTA
ncbi:hypothetical protein [Desulfobacula toluolica]|uniref:hypothetical protein n=1 Tax=Desulfobacula toluolica TaxID=28223 RepID=UPI00059C38B5|nr:hypothetical protein [Desulfobacula toluolica]